ncbi:MAG TPA: 2-phosphosulfolactate phosphatase [Ilumatobacteraceae bacterium]|nr:2-phosphosulfolactate phosphatase [Ilumatobacteraceae bacterium]
MVAELNSTRLPEFCTQSGFAYRCDWGLEGLEALASDSSVVIVVDVLRFSSAVCCALETGGVVLPYRWNDETAVEYAARHDAVLAGRREDSTLSLSPTDLLTMPTGTRLVLPSPNGSEIAFRAHELGVRHVLAGCLRNATATARAARTFSDGGPISVIAAGERWGSHDGSLRAAVEDILGAGAILAALDPSAAATAPACSPEAAAARAAFVAARPRLYDTLCTSASGRELLARGWEDDVATSAAHDVSTTVCHLDGNEFRAI